MGSENISQTLENSGIKNTQPDSISISTDSGCESIKEFQFQSQTQLCPELILKPKDKHTKDVEANKTNTLQPGEKGGIKRYRGILLAIVASFCFTLVILMVKVLKDYNMSAYSVSFWRFVGTTTPALPIFLVITYQDFKAGPSDKPYGVFKPLWPIFQDKNWVTWIGLILRSLLGSTSVILRYYAVRYLTVGDTSVITYSTPVIVTVLAHFLLGEKCGVVPVIITFTTLLGVGIVAKPPLLTGASKFDNDALTGTLLALGSLLCSSLVVVITRKIRKVNFSVTLLVVGCIGIPQAFLLEYFHGNHLPKVPDLLEDTLLVVGVALISFFAQMCNILALKYEQAAVVSLIRSCDIIFGFIMQYIFLDVVPDVWSATGCLIVISGITIITIRRWIETLQPKSKGRKYLGWILL